MSHDSAIAPRVSVTSLRWERVQLHLACVGDGVAPRALYFEDRRTQRRVPLSRVTATDGGFTVRADMMQLDDGYPLPTGTWALHAGDASADDAGAPPVLMHAGLRIDPAAYGGLFSGRGVRYWCVPSADRESGQFLLEISYRPRRNAKRSRARRWRGAFQRFREAAYVGTYRAARALVPRNGRRILFTSDSRPAISGNLLHVYRAMQERGLDETYRLRMIFKPSIKASRPPLDKLRFPIYLATSDVILMDDYQPMVYKIDFPDDVQVIQLWHASGAFKTVGYSRVGKPGGPVPFARGHRMYTNAIVSSTHDVPYYAEAFGIAEDKVVPTGIPRMDMFFDEDAKAEARERAYESVPQARGKTCVLFAPTFRGRGPADAYYDYELLDLEALYEVCEEKDAVVIAKMHPFIGEAMPIPDSLRDRIIDATELREVNDLLMIADLVITDYSSLVFEYSVLGGPMLFFAYDLEEYEAERDFYEPLVEFAPGKIVRTFPELIEAMRSGDYEQYKVAEFAREHFDHHDAGSSDRVIDDLILG
jgi:CDP-ribitol ribitolphosphotransferase